MNKEKLKKNISTFLFIYLIFIASYFSILTFSKYIGKSTGNGTTTIAKWEVSLDTSDNTSDTLNIVNGNTIQNYILKIISTSDVKAQYSIVLSNLPNQLEVKLDNGNYQIPTNNTITFTNVGYINANAQNRTATHTLTFNVPLNANTIEASEINIDVIFNQAIPTAN